jgi:electron transfer flavoprotein alpha subunit
LHVVVPRNDDMQHDQGNKRAAGAGASQLPDGSPRMTGWQILAVRCGGPQPTAIPDFEPPCLLVFPANADGEALAGGVAAATGADVLGRIVSVRRDGDRLIVSRSTHGGRLAIEVSVGIGIAVATANDLPQQAGEIALGAPTLLPLERTPLSDQSVALESARIVIGGGRGLDETGFSQLERIAKALGGAVAASLPAVDLGLAPVSRQVGQSGKFVTPEIYVAAGMSGTPQHMAGIGSATRIIAINKDPDAPIFGVAETGAVADAKTLLPLIGAALEAMNGEAA